MISKRFLIPFAILFTAFSGRAETSTFEVPFLDRPVVDLAQLLKENEKNLIEDQLAKIHQSNKAQMAVLILPSLNGVPIETVALQVVEKWKLGKKGTDKGLLLLIAPNDRRMRLEVGYGLEGDITDATSKQIISDFITPYFRKSRFADGILIGVGAVAQKLGIDLQVPVQRKLTRRKSRSSFPFSSIFFFGIILLFSIMRRSRGLGRGASSWHHTGGGGFGGGGGGGFGGGGFSGGGGGFGGGGASGGW